MQALQHLIDCIAMQRYQLVCIYIYIATSPVKCCLMVFTPSKTLLPWHVCVESLVFDVSSDGCVCSCTLSHN